MGMWSPMEATFSFKSLEQISNKYIRASTAQQFRGRDGCPGDKSSSKLKPIRFLPGAKLYINGGTPVTSLPSRENCPLKFLEKGFQHSVIGGLKSSAQFDWMHSELTE